MFVCRVIEKDEKLDGDVLTLDFGDQVVKLTSNSDADLDSLVKGASYSLAFIPQVAADAAHVPVVECDQLRPPVALADAPVVVSVDHPVVIDPVAAADAWPANPATIVVGNED